jgi:hypothetical protein
VSDRCLREELPISRGEGEEKAAARTSGTRAAILNKSSRHGALGATFRHIGRE